jgi:hypothetical protein
MDIHRWTYTDGHIQMDICRWTYTDGHIQRDIYIWVYTYGYTQMDICRGTYADVCSIYEASRAVIIRILVFYGKAACGTDVSEEPITFIFRVEGT